MYMLCIYENNIILSLFKIGTLNFTMYILAILHAFKNIRHWITYSNFSEHFLHHKSSKFNLANFVVVFMLPIFYKFYKVHKIV